MAKFRKKPIVVEAVAAIANFEVETPEGIMQVSRGDIIITGISGETYPCRLDIFMQTYEAVGEDCQQVIDLAMKMAHPQILKAVEQGVTLIVSPNKK